MLAVTILIIIAFQMRLPLGFTPFPTDFFLQVTHFPNDFRLQRYCFFLTYARISARKCKFNQEDCTFLQIPRELFCFLQIFWGKGLISPFGRGDDDFIAQIRKSPV